jgi:uncharacterized protein YacL
MVCSISCLVSAIFIISMIYFYNLSNKSTIVKHYREKLPRDLQIRYDKISNERLNISYRGYILGFIISFLVIIYNYNFRAKKFTNMSIVCLVIVITFLTNYLYYILSPKSDWLLYHINNSEQAKLWLQMYREMQFNYHLGFVLGIVGVGLLAFAFRC